MQEPRNAGEDHVPVGGGDPRTRQPAAKGDVASATDDGVQEMWREGDTGRLTGGLGTRLGHDLYIGKRHPRQN